MATIPRDLGSTFDPNDPVARAEFEGFGPEVPNTRGMITSVKNGDIDLATGVPTTPNAQSVRAAKLFSPGFLTELNNTPNTADNDNFPTPDLIVDVNGIDFSRSGARRDVEIFAPGDAAAANRIAVWSFRDNFTAADDDDIWPAPTIRVKEGQLVHTHMNNNHGPHTIHHHGIEPTAVNDGVGHLTMEIGGEGDGGNYHYQWRASESGTYFYHCHRNTTLHFELGMYGMLIVDPDVPGAPFSDGGPGMTLHGNTPVRYDKETFWVVDDIDISWRAMDKSEGVQDPNPFPQPFTGGFQPPRLRGGLNDFDPDFFVVTGVTVGANGALEAPSAAQLVRNEYLGALYNLIRPVIAPGEKLLVRALNASYCTTVWRFPTTVDGIVTAVDARTLGRTNNGFGSYSQPFRLSDLPLVRGHREFAFTTAQRWDVLVDTAGVGVHEVLVEFRHWLNYDEVLHTAILPITVA